MRPFFRLIFGVTFFAALLTAPALGQNDAVHFATYIEALPADATSTQSETARALERYRDSSRKEAGNLQLDALAELDRPNRFVILEAWRDAASFDAHDKADGTAKYRQMTDALLIAPRDIRTIAALFTEPRPYDNRPGAIYVVTHIDVTGDHKDDCVALLRTMSNDTIKESGKLRYDVFQQKNRPNHFTVVEAWANRKAQADHVAAAHTRAFRRQLLPMQGALYDERLYHALP